MCLILKMYFKTWLANYVIAQHLTIALIVNRVEGRPLKSLSILILAVLAWFFYYKVILMNMFYSELSLIYYYITHTIFILS